MDFTLIASIISFVSQGFFEPLKQITQSSKSIKKTLHLEGQYSHHYGRRRRGDEPWFDEEISRAFEYKQTLEGYEAVKRKEETCLIVQKVVDDAHNSLNKL